MVPRSPRERDGGANRPSTSPLLSRIIRREQELEVVLAKAREEARRRVDGARREAETVVERRRTQAERDAEDLLAGAEREAREEAERIVEAARREAAELPGRLRGSGDSVVERLLTMVLPGEDGKGGGRE